MLTFCWLISSLAVYRCSLTHAVMVPPLLTEAQETSADKASDRYSPDAVQQPPQLAPPSQPKEQNTSCFNLEEDYREAPQKPEASAVQDEKRDVGKSKADDSRDHGTD